MSQSIYEIAKEILLREAAGGQAAGSMELVKISASKAREYAEKVFSENGKELDVEIPNFDKNFTTAQEKAAMGKTKRKDMPVITSDDVKNLQTRLKNGDLDIHSPYSPKTNPKDPFPQGLKTSDAKEFLSRGKEDGEEHDDIVKYSLVKVPVGQLQPIQQQVYFDKSIDPIAENGAEGSAKFFTTKSILIASSDLRIIDGHHRFLGAVLIDPKMKVPVLLIDLPIDKLLPLTLAYGDSIGNKRNA